MKLSKEANIIDEELFCESHKARILSGGKLSEPFKRRLEQYAYLKGKKLCNKCYEVYEEEHKECR